MNQSIKKGVSSILARSLVSLYLVVRVSGLKMNKVNRLKIKGNLVTLEKCLIQDGNFIELSFQSKIFSQRTLNE